MVPSFAKLAPIAPCPALLAAGQANHIPVEGINPPGEAGSVSPGDSVTALITLFEKAGRRMQWLLYLETAGTNIIVKPGKPRMPLTWYTSAGDKMEFSQSPASALLRLL